MDPKYMLEYHFFEGLAEEDQDEVPAEWDDINHPIEIEVEPKSSKEQTIQKSSESEDEELDSKWTPSVDCRG